MSALLDRRARIARVRRVQHLHAAAEAARAEGRVASLESTADHLAQLTHALAPMPGGLSGGQLGNAAELAMRLDAVRDGMTGTILAARSTALEQVARRVEARIHQESAERLEERAARAAETSREQRIAAIPRPRVGTRE